MRSEGDVNLSLLRKQFVQRHLDAEALALIEDDARYFIHQSLSTPCLGVVDRAEGSHLIDTQGRRILDFHGNSVHQVGYGHPRVIEAVKHQLDRLPFLPRRYTNAVAVDLARQLSQIAPLRQTGQPARVLLAPGGSLAIGIALKLARYKTGRYKTVSMWDAFHGASLDAISIGGESLFRQDLGPLLPGCIHVPPYASDGLGQQSAEYVDYVLEKEGDVAAVVAEPMRWTTVVPPPADYWPQIRESCDRHGALLIIDEIPSCLGRTGKMFCIEHFQVEPDVLVVGKGLGGGVFPLAAVIARGDLNVAEDRAVGHYTHEKSSVGAAAALATLEVIRQERLVERAGELGASVADRLRSLMVRCPLIHDVRGLGLQLAIELRDDLGKAEAEAEQVMYECMERGLSFKVSDGNVLTLTPPLNISDTDMDTAIDILGAVLLKLS